MSYDCEECGDTFETLSELRLHTCEPALKDSPDDEGVSTTLDRLLEQTPLETAAVHEALAVYEARLATAQEVGNTEEYRTITRTYAEPIVAAVDASIEDNGWTALADLIEAYHPDTGDRLPFLTPVLENVTGRYVIRTRLEDGVASIPKEALTYFEAVYEAVDDEQDLIREGLHPYGWGIGHPDVAVGEQLQAIAAEDESLVNPMLEHACYADQDAAIDLLEKIVANLPSAADDTGTEFSTARYLLDAPAGAASRYEPTIPRYWDRIEEIGTRFTLSTINEDRIRAIVARENLDDELPDGWVMSDLLV